MSVTKRAPWALAISFVAATSPVAAQRGPAAVASQLPPDVQALACAPTFAFEAPIAPMRVTGGQDSFVRLSFSPGDLVTINAGTQNGIEVGQEFFVRRLQVLRGQQVTRETPASVQTAGWIRVYAVDEEWSLATIAHACDSINVDDYLEPFELPVVPAAANVRTKPERDNYGRIMTGTDRRRSFGKGDFFIVNRGSDQGVEAGSQFVIYRDKLQKENFLYELGEAVAVTVGPDTATLQVTLSRDAFTEGDYVAMRPKE